jgi:hypothetical protein
MKKDYENDILKVIKEHNIYSILDIFAYYSGCSRATFYNNELDKLDSIIKAIDDNKVKTKSTLKNKWLNSDNATLQIALFKLIATDDERKALSTNWNENQNTGNITINWSE